MNNSYFDKEMTLSYAFKLWDRGDGIGEISLFNTIIGYIHGKNQPSDGYYYDEELEQYVEDETVEYTPVSCFPGYLSSGHTLLKPFASTEIDCVEHLISLVQSLPDELLPPKPKGSVIDIFSGQEKFLISRGFDIDVIREGKTLHQNIIDNFNSFSSYLKHFLENFPEISIEFLNHSYVNGNVYVQYLLKQNYFLNIVFTEDNQLLVGKINKSGKFNIFTTLDSDNNCYQTICDSIVTTLDLSLQSAKIKLNISALLLQYVPRQKNSFFNEILSFQSEAFLVALTNRGQFLLQRDLNILDSTDIEIVVDREQLLIFKEKIKQFELDILYTLSLFMNYFLKHKHNLD